MRSEGAPHTSRGCNPGDRTVGMHPEHGWRGLGDAMTCIVPLQCGNVRGLIPRALPWAGMRCPVGAGIARSLTTQPPPARPQSASSPRSLSPPGATIPTDTSGCSSSPSRSRWRRSRCPSPYRSGRPSVQSPSPAPVCLLETPLRLRGRGRNRDQRQQAQTTHPSHLRLLQ